MRRYYSGDIDVKFWFGIQSSDAADRFGYIGEQPSSLEYNFDKDEHLPIIKKELKAIKKNLGSKLKLIERSIENNIIVQKLEGITEQDISEYADYLLGLKIKESLEENGSCFFEAEM